MPRWLSLDYRRNRAYAVRTLYLCVNFRKTYNDGDHDVLFHSDHDPVTRFENGDEREKC